ncbi:MAG: hypothetical protein L0J08_07995 [Micrococcaceae bacterium]|nr:hypothetical protein [Micrococcaceae bacterium]
MAHITPQLLEILRCPVTGSTLTQDGDALVASGEDDRGSTPRSCRRLRQGWGPA